MAQSLYKLLSRCVSLERTNRKSYSTQKKRAPLVLRIQCLDKKSVMSSVGVIGADIMALKCRTAAFSVSGHLRRKITGKLITDSATQSFCKGSPFFFLLKKKKDSNANQWLSSERAVTCREVDSRYKNLRHHGDTESWKIFSILIFVIYVGYYAPH